MRQSYRSSGLNRKATRGHTDDMEASRIGYTAPLQAIEVNHHITWRETDVRHRHLSSNRSTDTIFALCVVSPAPLQTLEVSHHGQGHVSLHALVGSGIERAMASASLRCIAPAHQFGLKGGVELSILTRIDPSTDHHKRVMCDADIWLHDLAIGPGQDPLSLALIILDPLKPSARVLLLSQVSR